MKYSNRRHVSLSWYFLGSFKCPLQKVNNELIIINIIILATLYFVFLPNRIREVTVPSLIIIDLWLGSSIKVQTAIVYAIESSEGVSLGKDFFRIRCPAWR